MADLSITANSVLKGTGAKTETLIAGAAITAGQTLYKDAADSNKAKLYDADGAAALRAFYGIALNSAASGQPVVVLTEGPITIGATVAVGVAYYGSDVAGGITGTFGDLEAGDYPTIIGIGISTTQIYVKPIAAGVTI
jgi:hypothetical protein